MCVWMDKRGTCVLCGRWGLGTVSTLHMLTLTNVQNFQARMYLQGHVLTLFCIVHMDICSQAHMCTCRIG